MKEINEYEFKQNIPLFSTLPLSVISIFDIIIIISVLLHELLNYFHESSPETLQFFVTVCVLTRHTTTSQKRNVSAY